MLQVLNPIIDDIYPAQKAMKNSPWNGIPRRIRNNNGQTGTE